MYGLYSYTILKNLIITRWRTSLVFLYYNKTLLWNVFHGKINYVFSQIVKFLPRTTWSKAETSRVEP